MKPLTGTPVQWNATDIDVGVRLAGALARHAAARGGGVIACAELLAQARTAHPRDAMLARAVPLGLGAKLQFIAAFCQRHGYADLSTLVAGAASPAAAQDWPAPGPEFAAQLAAFAKAAHAAVPARFKVRAERPADVAWYAYFRTHRAACGALSAEGKHEIINLLMAGLDPESALARVLAAQDAATA